MLAPVVLPPEYEQWNRRWHAPFGRSVPFKGSLAWSRPVLKFRGPFVFQPNSITRRFEYPWAHAQIRSRITAGTIVEVGGGMSGFQFVLAREGYDVINVDPGMAAKGKGWEVTAESHQYVARIFRSPARLIPTTLDQAALPDTSADVILSISTLEHLIDEDLTAAAGEIRRTLKPGGFLILTVDLFLDLQPFTATPRNKWGTNIDVRRFLSAAGVELIEGDRRQILGFPEFDSDAILRNRNTFLMGETSAVQCLVARPV